MPDVFTVFLNKDDDDDDDTAKTRLGGGGGGGAKRWSQPTPLPLYHDWGTFVCTSEG